MAASPKPTLEMKRRALRDQLFPNCESELWNRKTVNGFTTIPRTLGLIMTLLEQMFDRKKGHDVSRTYFELWCRAFDDYLVEVNDVEAFAFSAGFVSKSRNVRSWEERVKVLAELGFIRVAPSGTRKQAYVLLVDPHRVVKSLRDAGKIPQDWWGAYTKRASETGYALP